MQPGWIVQIDDAPLVPRPRERKVAHPVRQSPDQPQKWRRLSARALNPGPRHSIPTGDPSQCRARPPAANDLFRFPKAFAQLTHNVQHWTSPGAGGHFFALEQPVAMAKDLALFFHEVLDFGECIRAAPEPGALPPWTADAAAFYAALAAGVVAGVRACL